ncbi:spore germination protein [Lentibacillus sp. Marseille-P4043]|uniref:spore germination protein n=1 Tax=Lentibacillus sp. Marseille-P4043 TaxID=2040293 RepID=UPI000D0B674F|nr:spore germination protein [Lentibacillus sp. Marseille-P4043]
MKINRRRKKQPNSIFPLKVDKLKQIMQSKFENNEDLIFSIYEHQGKKIAVFFISYQADSDKVEDFLLDPLLSSKHEWTSSSILNEIPLGTGKTTVALEDILEKLLIGEVFIYVENEEEIVSYILLKKQHRQLSKAENETVVLGPQIAFTESLITNLNVVRWSIRSTDLVLEKIMVGKRYPREVRIVYVKSVANEVDVNTMRQRLQDLDIDELEDSTVLQQYLDDSSTSIFPQYYSTELPDRFSYAVRQGRIGVLTENSPTGFIAPTTFFSFFESTEDMYMRWQAGSFLRIMRFISMFLAVILTPLYVAAATYHYEIIPTAELITLGQSRAIVPFPPIIEALILEFLIELLREAGARLPTKIGQTIGIVGGVIIGQAVVEAGLTSSILIIVVALSALSSFTVPGYLMGTSIRVIRFPMMLLAGVLGLIGIMFGLIFLIIHLLRINSLGRPYLSPVYPFRWADLNKALFRAPLQYENKRFFSFRPKDLLRYRRGEAKRRHDIDE